MSGGGSLSLAGVLLLSQVEVLHLAGGEEAGCAALCRGKCLRWDWRQASHSCILDHRQDLRGVRQKQEEMVRKTTERRAKPNRKKSKPNRRTTKRTTSSTATVTTTVTTPATTEKSQRKTAGKRKSGQRKPAHSTKGKTLIVNEEIAEAQDEAQK